MKTLRGMKSYFSRSRFKKYKGAETLETRPEMYSGYEKMNYCSWSFRKAEKKKKKYIRLGTLGRS